MRGKDEGLLEITEKTPVPANLELYKDVKVNGQLIFQKIPTQKIDILIAGEL
ncbi:TPA: hypothetical protein RVR73_003054 [Aeromonas hydrophila]|nr:hypothetical protein [Aeromonas hydrophila]